MTGVQAVDEGGRSTISDSAKAFFLKVALSAIGFGASVLISRGLGPEGRGEYYLPLIAAGTVVVLCKLGLEHANVFMYGTRGHSIDRLSGQSGLVALSMGSLGLLLMLLAPSVLPSVFADSSPVLLLLVGLTIPFALHAQFAAGLLTLQGRVARPFRAALVAGAVQFALLLSLWLLRRFRVELALSIYLVTILLTWILTATSLDGKPWIRWDSELLKDTLKQSLLLHLAMVLFFLHLRVDMFMVKAMVGTAALGVYSLAVMLVETVLLPTDSLAIAMLPRQVGNTLEQAATIALRGARMNGLMGLGGAALWAAAGVLVIGAFFGSAFAPAYLPLLGLLPGMVFLGMQRACGGPVLRAGQPARMTAIYAVSLSCNVALNFWWIPLWGLFGAALSSSVSYGLSAVLFLAWTARLANASLSQAMLPTRSDWLSARHAYLRSVHTLRSTVFRRAILGLKPDAHVRR